MGNTDLLEKAFDTGYDAGLYRGFENSHKQRTRQIAKPSVMRFADFIRDSENTPSPTLSTATNRELLREMCKRFKIYATQGDCGFYELHDEPPHIKKGKTGPYWDSNGEVVCCQGEFPLDGPWQDSLIGPEGE